MSTLGNFFKVTTFGESHCKSVGVTIESPPPNFFINLDKIQSQLNRRRPGQSSITTPRDEKRDFSEMHPISQYGHPFTEDRNS